MLNDCDAHVIACSVASFQGAYTHGVICFALSWAMLCSRERSAPWNDRNVGVNVLSLQASVRPQAACTTMSAAPSPGLLQPIRLKSKSLEAAPASHPLRMHPMHATKRIPEIERNERRW